MDRGNIYDHEYVWNNSSEYDMIRWINNMFVGGKESGKVEML